MFDLTRKVNANSKGCGTIMRVAPVGLYFYRDPAAAYEEGKKSAAITHGHPTGQIAAGAFAEIIARVTGGEWLEDAIENVLKRVEGEERGGETASAVRLAVKLAESDAGTHASIAKLGEGWVAEEALAIAVFCAVRHQDDFAAAIRAAVNHKGDSDSTGAICGNILGTWLGKEAVEQAFDLEKLELRDVTETIARDLYRTHYKLPEPGEDAGQVADAVAVGILEALGVDLVDDGLFPPVLFVKVDHNNIPRFT